MSMRKIAALVVVILAVCSVCEANGRFVALPAIGMCTGDYVRYRAQPNTEAEIWGRMHKGEKVVVESRTSVNGETWYEILPHDTQDVAFISGKYMTPCYDEDVQRSPAGRLIPEIHTTYYFYDDYNDDGPEIECTYRDDWLVRVEIWDTENSFGDVHVGDKVSKLKQILGEPDELSGSKYIYIYSAGDYATFTFKIADGKITRMIYEEVN